MLLQLSPDRIHYVSSSTRKGVTDFDPKDRDKTASSRLTYVCGSVPFSPPLQRRSVDSLRRSCLSGRNWIRVATPQRVVSRAHPGCESCGG